MKKGLILTTTFAALALVLAACGESTSKPATSTKETSVVTSKEVVPQKSVTVTSIALGNEGSKAYITVRGTQENYTAEEFKWAWGLMDQNGTFDDGKETPSNDDYKPLTFNAANNQFTAKYCLTDITTLVAGKLYRIYGGTPESYGDIQFESNQFGAHDETRNYYLRQDQNNALTFDNIQPITYTKATIVEVTAQNAPTGVTQMGAYVKFGGANSKNLTTETINGWHDAGHIAGNFQRVIGGEYLLHAHVDAERFWAIEGNEVYFYLYVGFVVEGEGWMTHFDVVSGNEGAGLNIDGTINGVSYTVNGETYQVFADSSKSGEENYWGCLGIKRVAAA